MIIPIVDSTHFHRQARQIRARVQVILAQWGLPPKFNRWRLTQDPETGLIVLFAVLNNKYISTHIATPFSDYFDSRLLHDLANDLHVEVLSCKSEEQRYAFILDRGSLGKLPTNMDFPFLESDRLLVGVVYNDESEPEWINPQAMSTPPIHVEIADDLSLEAVS